MTPFAYRGLGKSSRSNLLADDVIWRHGVILGEQHMRERDGELQRAHHTIAMLREENDRLRRAAAAAHAALLPAKGSGGHGPPRQCRGHTSSGQPIPIDLDESAGERQ
jgi:hypothetical protein